MRTGPEAVLRFWFEEVGTEGWFAGGAALDAEIRARFGLGWRMARAGAFEAWEATAEGALALAVLLDQFPRNMHRGAALAFATDARARRVAARAVARGFDREVEEVARFFLYLPFEHSESLADQDRMVRLVAARMPRGRAYLLHARAHRAVIRRFGRFPFRNAALGRETTADEAAWLAAGGYGAEVARLGG